MPNRKTYIVEHLDPELGPWSELEYVAIARETARAGGTFVLSSVPAALAADLPATLAGEPAFRAETRGVEELYPGGEQRARVCLLDPRADRDISPDDKALFDVFLFGGILGEFSLALLLSLSLSLGHHFFLEKEIRYCVLAPPFFSQRGKNALYTGRLGAGWRIWGVCTYVLQSNLGCCCERR